MGDLINNFLQGNNQIPSQYYLKNTEAQEASQIQAKVPVKTSESQITPKKKKNGGYAKAVSSAIIPGSGQLFDGRYAPAAIYFMAPIAFLLGLRSSVKSFFKNGGEFIINTIKHIGAEFMEKSGKVKMLDKETFKNLSAKACVKSIGHGILAGICLLAIPILHGANIIDAYKGKRVKEIA